MKTLYGIMIGVMAAGLVSPSFAQDVIIPQVSNKPVSQKAIDNPIEPGLTPGTNGGGQKDYQTEVLSNPAISNVARAAQVTGGGGNTAVVVQKGKNNNSSVTQTGDNNYASQTQHGKSNDLRVRQTGKNNHSEEHQIGKYNHKYIIQNGDEQDSTTEQ